MSYPAYWIDRSWTRATVHFAHRIHIWGVSNEFTKLPFSWSADHEHYHQKPLWICDLIIFLCTLERTRMLYAFSFQLWDRCGQLNEVCTTSINSLASHCNCGVCALSSIETICMFMLCTSEPLLRCVDTISLMYVFWIAHKELSSHCAIFAKFGAASWRLHASNWESLKIFFWFCTSLWVHLLSRNCMYYIIH